RPAPKRRPCRRNACTLTPAIGARTRRVGICTSPIRQGSRRSTSIPGIVASTPLRVSAIPGTLSRRDGAPGAALFLFTRPGGRFDVKDVILTPEGYEKLKREIEFLSTDKRREVAERIKTAREFGDIAENAEYDDAKNEQAMLEHRIAQLEERLL